MFASMDYPLNEMENIKVTKGPTVIIYPARDKNMWYIYEGPYEEKAIMTWANQYLGKTVKTEL